MIPVYSEYKNTKFDWLKDIPLHWKVLKLKHVASLNMGQSPASNDVNQDSHGLPFIQGNAEFGSLHPSPKNYCTVPTKICEKDDILVSVRAPVGALNIANKKYVIGRGLSAITPKFIAQEFCWYTMHNSKYQLSVMETGTTFKAISGSDLGNVVVALPPIEEQESISRYLNYETSRIDRLIFEKINFISLLKEKRQALISHVVTKGLSPDVEMKDSNLIWAPEIPAHWNVKKLGYICKMQSGDSITSSGIEKSGSYPVFGGNGTRGYCENYNHEGCYILIGRQGSLCGNINYASGKFFASEHAIVVYPSDTVQMQWLGETLGVMNLIQYSVSAAIPGLSVSNILQLKIPVPPESEQRLIADHIKLETSLIDRLISEVAISTKLLKERRTALISAAVTGKIDLREKEVA